MIKSKLEQKKELEKSNKLAKEKEKYEIGDEYRTKYQTRFKVPTNVEEESDYYYSTFQHINSYVYKYCVVMILLIFITMLSTIGYLIFRQDSRFFASAPDGRIYELETREKPNGSFHVTPIENLKQGGQ